MNCEVSEQQLWSWIDQKSPELERHLCACPRCREVADRMRTEIDALRIDPPPVRFCLPDWIGTYRVQRLLGEGGQGVVYAAEQQTPRRLVALKVLKGGLHVADHELRHFQREVQTLGTLHHPGIATIFEAGRTEEGHHFFAMELVSGLPLGAYLRERNLSQRRRLELFASICDAVAYAHAHGVVHRDLKPGNVVVDSDDKPHVLDFGLARLTDADKTLTTIVTAPGLMVGTLRYMSPEQARGTPSQVDARSDIYALGVILYELLTGQPPYDTGASIGQAVLAICETAPRRPSSVSRALRGDIETIVLKALEKEPARRYASVAALAEDIRRYLAGEPIDARPASRLYRLQKKVQKNRRAVAVAAVALLIAAAGVWRGARQHEASNDTLLQDVRRHALGVMRQIETGPIELCIPEAATFCGTYRFAPEASLISSKAYFRTSQEQGDAVMLRTAIDCLEPELSGRGEPWANFQLLGELLIASRTDADRGQWLLNQAAAQTPATAEGWYLRSLATMELDLKVKYARQAVRLDPGHVLAWERLALLYADCGDEKGAREAAGHVTEVGRGVSGATEVQGHVLLRDRRYEAAIVAYTHGISVNPYSATCYRQRALAQECLQRYEQAAADYAEAIRLSLPSAVTWGRYHRATVLWILGRHDEARADYEFARDWRRVPSFADARLFLVRLDYARVLTEKGQTDEAEAVRSEALAALNEVRRITTAGSWLAAVLDCLAGDISPQQLLTAADMANPEAVCESWYYAGEVCLLNGQIPEAREFFSRCVETRMVFDKQAFPPDPMNEYHLSRWRLGALNAATGSGETRILTRGTSDSPETDNE